jgi:tetratricopeptide (TPR) repeat protein
MAGVSEDRDRQVVPRWRSFRTTLDHGELSTLKPPKDPIDWSGALEELLKDWAHHKGISTAADLVSAAFVSSREGDAVEAATFLLKQDEVPYGAKSIAALCLQKLGETASLIDALPESDTDDVGAILHCARERRFQVQIHRVRAQLACFPRNPVLWSNLARLYTSVGSQRKAEQAMRVGLALAPENRFILRSATRLMLHQGEGRQAHQLLIAAQCIRYDPWVLSAEIATAAALNRTSKNIKHARKILESGRFSPFHLSELASAIGTLEAAAGNRRSSRMLISQSLQQPSENAVAQAAWLSRNTGIIASTAMDVSQSPEAVAWQAFQAADWDRSLSGTQVWFEDQPFSSRPAIHGSHLASTVLENHDLAIEFAQNGLLSNPDDVCLYNNLAFSLAQQGDIERAAKAMSKVDPKSLSSEQSIYVAATLGLIEFRAGHQEQGRELYRRASQIARAIKDEKGKLAQVYLAFEELRVAAPHAEQSRREALEATSHLTEPSGKTHFILPYYRRSP